MKKLLAAAALAIAVPATSFAAPRLAGDASLPTADRIDPYIKAKLGAVASADINLCIAPDGHVTSVAIVKSSTYTPFDNAVMRDVSDWQFAASDADRCMRTTIAYHTK